jgi:restriction endonuclease S subunit
MVELGKICNVRDGTHDSPVPVQVGHPLITSKNLKNGTIDFENINLISEIDYNKVNQRSKVDFGDILMPMIGTIGNPVIVNIEPNFAIKNVALIKFNDSTIINDFVFLILSSKRFEKFIENTKRGGTQNFISLKDIRSYLIPHPPLTVQQKIVNQINNEISLVNQSKQLITIFEQKIKDRISEVWGD